jgi:PrgI family protein
MSAKDNGLRQEIATHLEVEDRILFGLTLRQAIIVLVGLSVGYSAYAQLGRLGWPLGPAGAHPPQALCIVAGIIPALLALVCAVVEIGGRPIEEWALALVRYAALPKRYVWRSRPPQLDAEARGDGASGGRAASVQSSAGEAEAPSIVATSLLEEGDDPW